MIFLVKSQNKNLKILLSKLFQGFGARHTFTLFSFLGFVNILAMNICLSVAIVAMVSRNGESSLKSIFNL